MQTIEQTPVPPPTASNERVTESLDSLIMSIAAACGHESLLEVLEIPDADQRRRAILDWMADWPPDLFAFTTAVLQRTGTYRFTAAPP
jgi:hypothetical protein